MADEMKAGPPSVEGMIDYARREGFYESAVKMQDKRLNHLYNELRETQASLDRAKGRIAELEDELGDAWSLARKYGTITTAERRKETGTLQGRLSIADDLIAKDGAATIRFACHDLAKKLIAQSPRAASPTEEPNA